MDAAKMVNDGDEMTDNTLVLHGNSALSVYHDRDDVRELGDRLLRMHPAASEVGPDAMRAAAQLALLLGANPLPGVNELHIWRDNKNNRNCMSLGINYWRRKGREWGGYLYEIQPRPMRQNEMAEFGMTNGTLAAICKGCRTEDMIRFKQLGFTTAEIWDMCGRTGIGTQGPNEYPKSGRPNIWTSLKRAETDMLRQLFPAEFGNINRQVITGELPITVIEEVTDDDMPESIEATAYTLADANEDLFGVQQTHPPADALLYEDGSFVANDPRTYAIYNDYVKAHDGKAPANRFNLQAWHNKQKNGNAQPTPAEAPAQGTQDDLFGELAPEPQAGAFVDPQ